MPGDLPIRLVPRNFALPTCPTPARVVGLAALPGARGPSRLFAASGGGRLLRLRPGGPPVERAVDLQVGTG